MTKKKNTDSVNDVVTDTDYEVDADGDEIHPDDYSPTPDSFEEEEGFEFDPQLIPEGIKLVELAPDFIRPDGFLMVPRINKKTGEIFPPNATFAGILHDIIPWKDNRGKERVWFACEATASIPGATLVSRDEKNRETRQPVKKGCRVGISGSGAINALRAKKGHFILLHWTGSKVTVKNGDMWEVKAMVSEAPVVPQG